MPLVGALIDRLDLAKERISTETSKTEKQRENTHTKRKPTQLSKNCETVEMVE